MPLVQFAPVDVVDPDPPVTIAALHSADADVRRAAVWAVNATADGPVLVAHLGVEPDPGIRALIIDRLVETRDLDVARPLLALIRSADIGLRNAVIAALPLLGEALLPGLPLLLEDADPAVRIATVNLLQGMSGRRAADLALATIANDPHVNVCAAAVDVLAEHGDADAVAPLHALVRRFPDAPFIAFAVDAAIARIS